MKINKLIQLLNLATQICSTKIVLCVENKALPTDDLWIETELADAELKIDPESKTAIIYLKGATK